MIIVKFLNFLRDLNSLFQKDEDQFSQTIQSAKDKSKHAPPKKEAPKAPQKGGKKAPSKDSKDGGSVPESEDMTDSEAFVKADRNEIKQKPTRNMETPKPQMTESEEDVKADRNESGPKPTRNMETPRPQMTDSEEDVKADRGEIQDLPGGGDKKTI